MGILMTVPMLLDNVMDTDTNEVATQTGNGTVFIEIENGTVNI
jgi:hypothetical protein